MLKMLSNKDSMIRTLLLLLGGILQTLATLTVVANFGWTHGLSFIFYGITAVIYFVIYLLWKN